MSHPPVLAVTVAIVLAIATAVETYRSATLPKPGIDQNAARTVRPTQQLDHALQALRIDVNRDSASAM